MTVTTEVDGGAADALSARPRLERLAARWLPPGAKGRPLRVLDDTSDFFRIGYGDVLVLGGELFLVRHNAKEGRFGLDDEVKHWVKRAIRLGDGSLKILKLVFHERFTTRIGDLVYDCYRSPEKEARILALVAGHPHFMQGYTAPDVRGNPVRVIDFVHGPSLAARVDALDLPHEAYFHEVLPGLLAAFCESVRAIGFLHDHGEKHGDIRRDHLIVDRHSGRFRWIDFDYNYRHRDNVYSYDLFGLGNVLVYLVGKGDVRFGALREAGHPALASLCPEDANIVFQHRLANLRKVYPYIPEGLNRVLLHFSSGARWHYETTGQLLDDLSSHLAAA